MRGVIVTYSAKVGRLTLRPFPLLLFTKSLSFLPIMSLCEMSPLSHVGVSIFIPAADASSIAILGALLIFGNMSCLLIRSVI